MANLRHHEHEAMTAWYGGLFDPVDIDEERINSGLAAIAQRRQGGSAPGRV